MLMTVQYRYYSSPQKKLNFRFLFSWVGLAILLALYTVLGDDNSKILVTLVLVILFLTQAPSTSTSASVPWRSTGRRLPKMPRRTSR